MRSTFKMLFYVNRQKVKKDGKCLIMGRVTLDGTVAQYSTGKEVAPECWNPQAGRIKLKGSYSPEELKNAKKINQYLNGLGKKAKTTVADYTDSIGYVTAEIVKNVLTGQAQAKETLITLLDEHNEEYSKRVGIDRVRHSYVRYLTSRKHIYNFLQYKYDVEDIPLRSLNMQFINDYHFYLSTVLKQKTASLNDHLIVLRKIARLAVKQKTLKRDPFAGYRMEKSPRKHNHLTEEQLHKIMQAELHTYRLCHTRDLFVFSAFTGIGRADLANLTTDNIVVGEKGELEIRIARQKTKEACYIKLTEIPIAIMNKYKGEGKGNKLFYVPQTCNLCRTLVMIKDICKLDCHLTFYMARHTFATECLNWGIPIETISKMMGHSSIRTTQIYAEITNKKVERDLAVISQKTKGAYSIPDDKMPSRVYKCGRYSGWKNEISKDQNHG